MLHTHPIEPAARSDLTKVLRCRKLLAGDASPALACGSAAGTNVPTHHVPPTG